jgi:hypothetical protein
MSAGGEALSPGFRVPVLGMIGGFFGAIGCLLLFQQFEIFYPTRTMTIAFLVGGVLLNLVVANVVAAMARGDRTGRVLVETPAFEQPQPEQAPYEQAPYEQPTVMTPTATVAEEPTVVLPIADVEAAAVEPVWAPTHVVPAGGMQAWTDPDPQAAPVSTLDPGLDVVVDRRLGDWAHVSCSNGWAAWVDGRLLEEFIR